MKQKWKDFFGSRLYVGLVCCLAFAAVIGAGLSGLERKQGAQEQQNAAGMEESVAADVNRNAPVVREQPEVQPERTPEPAGTPQPEPAPQAQTEPEEAPVSAEAVPTFSWPVEGEVVLPFSTDVAIYDPTLDQYRTNEVVAIQAEEGEAVKAAAAGTVSEVMEDSIHGTQVVIAHQNGWQTTYGQLEAAVRPGQTLTAGETVVYVVSPTKYGVALGPHVDFQVLRDGAAIDPATALATE